MPTPANLPLSRRIELDSPAAALQALRDLPHAFLLDSTATGRRAGWSFFGADPFEIHRGSPDMATADAWRRAATALGVTPGAATADTPDGVPFRGGAVGYWSYDFGRRFERIPDLAADDLRLPDHVVGFYDVTGAFEHGTGRAWLFSSGLPEAGAAAMARAGERLEWFARRFEARTPGATAAGTHSAALPGDVAPASPLQAQPLRAVSTFTPEAYRQAVQTVRHHIAIGDLFQANLSQRWRLPLEGPAATADRARGEADGGRPTPSALHDPAEPRYRGVAHALRAALAGVSPAPFAAWFDGGDHAVVSSSPERFLELRGRRVEARPIKGTRPRGMCAAEDEQLAAELTASAKDRAENVMIVDVLRNDLGRVCETGSIAVPELCALETFPQVFHLTSTVTGTLRPEFGPFELLAAAFPGGSITGAPKIRAMILLETLEPVRRHIYTGAIGYVGWDGDADWNIAIRTALVTPDAVYFAAGGGITAESDPEAEFLETLHKAEGLRLACSVVLGPVALTPPPAIGRAERSGIGR